MDTMTSVFALLANIATIFGVVGVWFAVQQLGLSKKLAQSAFEDELSREYRSIVKDIPMDVLLGKLPKTEEEKTRSRELIYNYIDLCNQQVFLRMNGRIIDDTWREWCEGIKSIMSKGLFLEVWKEIQTASPGLFDELKHLLEKDFKEDPKTWRGGFP